MLVLKVGALYFAVTFAAGWILGPIREFWVIPRFGRTTGLLAEAPLMLIVSFGAARWALRRMAVPPRHTMRALVGLVALGLLVIAELIGTQWLRGLSLADYLTGFRSLPGVITAASFLLFAAMPTLVARSPSHNEKGVRGSVSRHEAHAARITNVPARRGASWPRGRGCRRGRGRGTRRGGRHPDHWIT
jgi:hypothetical protein